MNSLIDLGMEATLRVESALCSRFRCTKSDCAACAVVCPAPGAVRLGEAGAEIIGTACVGCGACVAACPNGAIQSRESDALLAERIRQRVQPDAVFRIACTRAQGQADFVLPCLSRLTEALVLEPLRNKASRVDLCAPDCSTCGLAKASHQWVKTMSFAGMLCEAAGLGAERVGRLAMPSGKAEEKPRPAKTGNPRRALFRAMAERWKASGDEATPTSNEPAAASEPFREVVQRHGENVKRIGLMSLLTALPGAVPASKVVASAGVPCAQPEVDHKCVGCNVCETLCPVGALSHREEGGTWALEFDGALCTGCRVCEATCFHQAIRIRDTADLFVLFGRPKTTLVSAFRRTCKTCRESFLDASSSESCPSCRLSGDRREAIVRQFFIGGNPA